MSTIDDTLDDATLDRLLASVGRHLDTHAPAVAHTTGGGRQWSGRRRVALAAAVLIVVVLGVAAIAPVRRTVADWLGIGSTTVVHVPGSATPGTLPSITAGLRPIDADEAGRRLGRPLPDTTSTRLGEPQALLAMPEGGVLMVWAEGATTLWVHATDLPAPLLVKKLVGAGEPVQFVSGLGDGALMITGDHILVTPRRTVAAGTVLLWTDGSTELRLESDLPAAEMIALAQQLA